MKILIYAHLFPPSLGGMQYQNLDIAQGLYDLGHEVEVVACNNEGAEQFVKDLNFPVYLLKKWPFVPMHSLSGISRINWVFILSYLIKINQILRRNRPDIIIVADETSNFFWGFWAKSCKIPYISYCSVPILSVYRTYWKSNLKRRIFGILQLFVFKMLEVSYENSQRIIAVSTSTKNELIKEVPRFETKLSVVPNSIDKRYFNLPVQDNIQETIKKEFGLQKDHFILLSVTRLAPDKGVETVIKAIKRIPPSELRRLRYLIVGEGPILESLKRLTKKFFLTENIIFTGGMPHLDLIPYYDLCDLFVLPPKRGPMESFGRVFVEAATRSKPSIASREGGMLDVIDDGTTGFLVAPGDSSAIGEHIVNLMNNKGELKSLGENARLKAETLYTSKNVALRFDQLLMETV